MSTADPVGAPATDDPATRLGRAIGVRLRRPGPPVGLPRPAPIGSVASAATRFALGWGRPVAVRRLLAGPARPVRAADAGPAAVRPPRWWSETTLAGKNVDAEAPVAPVETRRGLPRVVQRMPDEAPRRPGAVTAQLAPQTVPMRLPDEVAAAGRLVGPADGRSRRPSAAPPPRDAPGKTEESGRTSPTAPHGRGVRTPATPATTHAPVGAHARGGQAPAAPPATRLLRRRALATAAAEAGRPRRGVEESARRQSVATPVPAKPTGSVPTRPAPTAAAATRPVPTAADGAPAAVPTTAPAGAAPPSGVPTTAGPGTTATVAQTTARDAAGRQGSRPRGPGADLSLPDTPGPGSRHDASAPASAAEAGVASGGPVGTPASSEPVGTVHRGPAPAGTGPSAADTATGTMADVASSAAPGRPGGSAAPDSPGRPRLTRQAPVPVATSLPTALRRMLAGAVRRTAAVLARQPRPGPTDPTGVTRRSVSPQAAAWHVAAEHAQSADATRATTPSPATAPASPGSVPGAAAPAGRHAAPTAPDLRPGPATTGASPAPGSAGTGRTGTRPTTHGTTTDGPATSAHGAAAPRGTADEPGHVGEHSRADEHSPAARRAAPELDVQATGTGTAPSAPTGTPFGHLPGAGHRRTGRWGAAPLGVEPPAVRRASRWAVGGTSSRPSQGAPTVPTAGARVPAPLVSGTAAAVRRSPTTDSTSPVAGRPTTAPRTAEPAGTGAVARNAAGPGTALLLLAPRPVTTTASGASARSTGAAAPAVARRRTAAAHPERAAGTTATHPGQAARADGPAGSRPPLGPAAGDSGRRSTTTTAGRTVASAGHRSGMHTTVGLGPAPDRSGLFGPSPFGPAFASAPPALGGAGSRAAVLAAGGPGAAVPGVALLAGAASGAPATPLVARRSLTTGWLPARPATQRGSTTIGTGRAPSVPPSAPSWQPAFPSSWSMQPPRTVVRDGGTGTAGTGGAGAVSLGSARRNEELSPVVRDLLRGTGDRGIGRTDRSSAPPAPSGISVPGSSSTRSVSSPAPLPGGPTMSTDVEDRIVRRVMSEVEERIVERLDEWAQAELDDHVQRIVERRLQEETERRSWRHSTEVF